MRIDFLVEDGIRYKRVDTSSADHTWQNGDLLPLLSNGRLGLGLRAITLDDRKTVIIVDIKSVSRLPYSFCHTPWLCTRGRCEKDPVCND